MLVYQRVSILGGSNNGMYGKVGGVCVEQIVHGLGLVSYNDPNHRTTPNKPVSDQDMYDTCSGQVASELMQLLHESKYIELYIWTYIFHVF